ncbi:unnamed protein product [Adineta steineri]|uniref:Reverse transcriptase domain-containing protein n=1 Tax=Adineta steineri TaxID=433720 RepID=A0A815JHU6_9BILA|nr:unnamed protein product [Adineta steineri]
MYLQQSSWILFQTSGKRLNYSLNDKHKQYIYTRLTILDHTYCLEVHLQLCKSFLEIGRTEHHWPEEVQLLSKTDDYQLCFQYLTNYIGHLNEQTNQYETELTTQLSSYSMIPISINQVHTCLKEYVNHQRQYLVTKNSNQLAKLQDEILANKLYEMIMASYSNLNTNQFIDQLISIRQKQTQILEELLQLEMRILYKFLPSDLDQQEKIVALIAYIPLNNKRYKMIQDAKRQCCYFTPLPYKDHIEAQEQSQTTASIRQKIKQFKLIIRVTDKSNNFYIGSAIEFEKKVQQYFMDTNAFIEIKENLFNEIVNKVTQLLNNLRSKKLILQWQYNEMTPDRKTTELAHLYFNPKTHKDGIPLRPIENTIRAPTINIFKFLDKILRPIFDDKCTKTTIIDGAHLITAIKTYVNKGLLKSSTLFCTFDIRNLYTMLLQEEALNILLKFLHLHENVFVYDNKIYQQITGGAMGSSFTLTLANIFMWKWQRELVRQQDITCEFYGRYIDDIFMTWNRSEHELRKLLDQAYTWHPNIKLDYKISQSLSFLDFLLTNNNGILSTSYYHKPNAKPYVVPFNSDHPRHVFVNIIKTLLTRAVRYSSTFETFNYERHIPRLLLINNFINFSINSFIQHQFILLRHEILDQPTPSQSQAASRAATADVDNDQTHVTAETTSRELIEKIQKKPVNYVDRLFLHYTHEKRFKPFKRNMHRVYQNVFKNTPAMDLRLIVGNRNRRNAKNELIRKRPKRSLLQCKKIQNKYKKMLGKLSS